MQDTKENYNRQRRAIVKIFWILVDLIGISTTANLRKGKTRC